MIARAPAWKFRLLCKRCNSYRHTSIEIDRAQVRLRCERCDVEASSLGETSDRNEWDDAV